MKSRNVLLLTVSLMFSLSTLPSDAEASKTGGINQELTKALGDRGRKMTRQPRSQQGKKGVTSTRSKREQLVRRGRVANLRSPRPSVSEKEEKPQPVTGSSSFVSHLTQLPNENQILGVLKQPGRLDKILKQNVPCFGVKFPGVLDTKELQTLYKAGKSDTQTFNYTLLRNNSLKAAFKMVSAAEMAMNRALNGGSVSVNGKTEQQLPKAAYGVFLRPELDPNGTNVLGATSTAYRLTYMLVERESNGSTNPIISEGSGKVQKFGVTYHPTGKSNVESTKGDVSDL